MKRTLSLFLAVALVITMFTGLAMTNAADTRYSDVPTTHWAYSYIDYLSYKNVLTGDGSGKFRPDDLVSRAEFIKMIDELFGLKTTRATSFTNVPKWAVSYIEKAAGQGYLLAYNKDTDFNEKLTREEAVALLMRYLDLPRDTEIKTINISDYYSIDAKYRDYVVQAVNANIVSGYVDGAFRPKNNLTRAEALTILYMAAGAIYDQSAYATATGAASTNAVIKSNAALYNVRLTGRIIIGEDVEFVSFINCSISGEIYVRGETVVSFKGTDAPYVHFLGYEGELKLNEKSVIKTTEISNKTFINIDEKCAIETLTINSNAKNTKADGTGEIKKINIYAAGVDTGDIMPAEYYIHKGLTATFSGQGFSEGTGKTALTAFKSAYVVGGCHYDGYPSSTNNISYDIYISVIPAVDGYIYVAAWENTKAAMTPQEIYRSCEDNYGTFMMVKAGFNYNIGISVPSNYENYNIGMILVTDDFSPNARIAGAAYNQGKISSVPSAMSKDPTVIVPMAAPTWYASVSSDSKSIVLVFDQPMYVYKDHKLTKISNLTQNELKKLFSMEATPAKQASRYPSFKVEVYDGPTTIVYLTPDEGLFAGEYYYVYPMDVLYNAQGIKTDIVYDYVYLRSLIQPRSW